MSDSRLASFCWNDCESERIVPSVAESIGVVAWPISELAYWFWTVAWVVESSDE